MKSFARVLIAATGFGLMAMLGGCAMSDEGLGGAFVAPNKFTLYTCPELARRQNEIATRQAELEGLMAKAKQGAGGAVASAMAYETDYLAARGEMKVLRDEAAAKHCTLPPPQVAAPAPSVAGSGVQPGSGTTRR